MGDRPFLFESGVEFVEWGTDLLCLKPELDLRDGGTVSLFSDGRGVGEKGTDLC